MAFERLVPDTDEWTAFYANHLHRYMFSANRLGDARPRRVLDAACGVGYGSRWLATQLRTSVVGIDRDADALRIAEQRFADPAVQYRRDDCHTLAACRDARPFDAVVSFETVEHLPRPADFLNCCREVLRPEGQLIVSSPNASARGPELLADWEFHVQEFSARQFADLLADAGFRDVRLFGQQLTPLGRLRQEMRGELHKLRSNPVVRAGTWLQRMLRGRPRPGPILPEVVDDLEIVPIASSEHCDELGKQGPFVLLGVATK